MASPAIAYEDKINEVTTEYPFLAGVLAGESGQRLEVDGICLPCWEITPMEKGFPYFCERVRPAFFVYSPADHNATFIVQMTYLHAHQTHKLAQWMQLSTTERADVLAESAALVANAYSQIKTSAVDNPTELEDEFWLTYFYAILLRAEGTGGEAAARAAERLRDHRAARQDLPGSAPERETEIIAKLQRRKGFRVPRELPPPSEKRTSAQRKRDQKKRHRARLAEQLAQQNGVGVDDVDDPESDEVEDPAVGVENARDGVDDPARDDPESDEVEDPAVGKVTGGLPDHPRTAQPKPRISRFWADEVEKGEEMTFDEDFWEKLPGPDATPKHNDSDPTPVIHQPPL